MKHLLSRRLRAALNYKMSKWDWICHGWWLIFDSKYRASVRAVQTSINPSSIKDADWPAKRAATAYLRRKLNKCH